MLCFKLFRFIISSLLILYSDSFPSRSPSPTFHKMANIFSPTLFRDSLETEHKEPTDDKNNFPVFKEELTGKEKSELLSPVIKNPSAFVTSKTKERERDNEENQFLSGDSGVFYHGPNPKRKRKTMSIIKFKKYKSGNRPKRRHSVHENKTKLKTSVVDLEDHILSSDRLTGSQISVDEMTTPFSDPSTMNEIKNPNTNLLDVSNRPKDIQEYQSDTTTMLPSTSAFPQIVNLTGISSSEGNSTNVLNKSVAFQKGTKHINLQRLEKELVHMKKGSNQDLLLAISILQHHDLPDKLKKDFDDISQRAQKVKQNYVKSFRNAEDIADYKLFQDMEEGEIYFKEELDSSKKQPKTARPFTFKVEINEAFSSNKDISDEINESLSENQLEPSNVVHESSPKPFSTKERKKLNWFVLVMDGNCTIIRHRMSSFVTFLKAALSAKLDTSYDDIYVPSVFCHKTFMVNITIDVAKYPQAEDKLQSLAKANTTLLELSGEIFYLEKMLKGSVLKGSNSMTYFYRNDDIRVVIYIAVGCMCVFILLSVIIVLLIKVCRQDDTIVDKEDIVCKIDIPPSRRPNVIYSQNFTQSLNPEKYLLNDEEPPTTTPVSEDPTIGSTSSRPLDAYLHHDLDKSKDCGALSNSHGERKLSSIPSSVSKLRLLEEVQEEEEEEEENYRDENETNEVDDNRNDDIKGKYEEHEDHEDDDGENDTSETDEGDEEEQIIKSKFKHLHGRLAVASDTKSSPVLIRGIRSSNLPPSGNESTTTANEIQQTSFENPCYER